MKLRRVPLTLAWMMAMALFAITSLTGASTGFSITSIQPNPFDPTQGEMTTVTFSVPIPCSCRVVVTNSANNQVAILLNTKSIAPGVYTQQWSGKTTSGETLPKGNYIVTVSGATAKGMSVASASARVSIGKGTPSVRQFTIDTLQPNPFSPATGDICAIRYTVPISASYRVRVLQGTVLLRELENRSGTDGSYTTNWDGKDQAGRVPPDGQYAVMIDGSASDGSPITSCAQTVTIKTVPALAITGITPATFNPADGETAMIKYTVPVTASIQLTICNADGAQVRALYSNTRLTAGSRSIVWNGKNDQGTVLPTGMYTVYLKGTGVDGGALISASAPVTIDIPEPCEYGQTLEGMGSANFNWLTNADTKFSIAFRAPRSGAITGLITQWRTAPGYGAGNLGTYSFELHGNGPDNFPGATIVASTSGVRPEVDGYIRFALSASLTEGEIYHLVVYNTDPDPATNWSSPNTLMTRIRPWDGTGFTCSVCEHGAWRPWCSQWNPFNTQRDNYVNGSHSPLMLSWDDGGVWGDPYWSAAVTSGPAYFYGKNRAGELIVWNHPAAKISQIGISVMRKGTPGPLLYHLEQIGVGDLATGTIATSQNIASGDTPTWVYKKLATPVTLKSGVSYRLWFESPKSRNSSNYYYQYPVYGRGELPEWLEAGWGGTQSRYLTSTGNGWIDLVTHELTFSLQ